MFLQVMDVGLLHNVDKWTSMSLKHLAVSTLLLGACLASPETSAQTDGSASMSVKINDYVGTTGTAHWTVVWVTTESGTFVKTLYLQGTSYPTTSSQWNTHTPQWVAARGGVSSNTVVDGFTGATAANYTGSNSPVNVTWNCRNQSNVLVPDGNYKFWVQYVENSGAGPYTTNGLLWTGAPPAPPPPTPTKGPISPT
ncbi:MAG: DUF2271 domain-containing protein [Kiritimatiellia bacterium]